MARRLDPQAAQKRASSATGGRWVVEVEKDGGEVIEIRIVRLHNPPRKSSRDVVILADPDLSHEDAAFIAAARQDVPALARKTLELQEALLFALVALEGNLSQEARRARWFSKGALAGLPKVDLTSFVSGDCARVQDRLAGDAGAEQEAGAGGEPEASEPEEEPGTVVETRVPLHVPATLGRRPIRARLHVEPRAKREIPST